MENHWGIVPDAADLLRIVHEVESDWFGISLDTGNFAKADPYAEMKKVLPFTINVQLKVEVRTATGGKAKADFQRIIDLLHEGGYRGYVALDYESDGEPKEDIPRHIERLRRILVSK
jgi:sugar phosphate isomerase/epimerase